MNIDTPRSDELIEVRGTSFTFGDINQVVKNFYRQVAEHRHLKVPFSTVEDWPHHIDNLTHFWWIRFGGRPYLEVQYNPVQKHFETGYNEEFLDMWLTLFKDVLDSTLSKNQANLWFMFAEGIGNALTYHNEAMKKHYSK